MLHTWSPEKKYSDKERWICVYPAYFNSKKTLAEGRRLPKEKCIENPNCQEIKDVLTAAGVSIVIEQNKMYPRDPNRDPNTKGRIRINLKNDDGSFVNPEFNSKTSILIYCADMIPKLKSRQLRTGTEQSQQSGAKKSKGKKGKR
uniref:Signal recognition particle 19 kDa protein n=1 Tax=Strigamia maritima TaxID=126957 RepID=T1J0P8_STRMM